ncbi:hypothetical protein GJU39_06055 [Pedobacter petrophilus]|uniref:Uncharacterized protein n=1 Tax=Pedobacter petrophilus TaxID=1908241 RepID=A0A7K0FVS1_9SPHI|nr:hypothetical protein [Pedobacter petrophilus]MRX75648.1 hypothetical protein [Pedobacter petrophilus]
MKTTHSLLFTFLVVIISSCQNPSDRAVKGNGKRDYGDTLNKDSVQAPKRLDAQDTVGGH